MTLIEYFVTSAVLVTISFMIFLISVFPKSWREYRLIRNHYLTQILFFIVISQLILLGTIDYILVCRLVGCLPRAMTGIVLIYVGVELLINAIGWYLLYNYRLKRK